MSYYREECSGPETSTSNKLFKRVICMQRNKCTGFSKDTVLS